jgi:hypothetical protein
MPPRWKVSMPQICNIGPTALLPHRRKACCGFFRLKNPTASNPLSWVPEASMLTTRPPKTLYISLTLQIMPKFLKLSDPPIHRHVTTLTWKCFPFLTFSILALYAGGLKLQPQPQAQVMPVSDQNHSLPNPSHSTRKIVLSFNSKYP